ncbi:MAG: antitoxin [Candidatus Altiarchaeales archaeon]|nr:MAG: antitoxin [Candidatus Altiarchaeales archaeon]
MESIPAIYEGGVFKPLKKVELKEHTEVKIVIKPKKKIVNRVMGRWDFITDTEEFMRILRKGWGKWKF